MKNLFMNLLKQIQNKQPSSCFVLSTEPIVIIMEWDVFINEYKSFKSYFEMQSDAEVYFLFHLKIEDYNSSFLIEALGIQGLSSNFKFQFMAPTQGMALELMKNGIRAHHNSFDFFIDHRKVEPMNKDKHFDSCLWDSFSDIDTDFMDQELKNLLLISGLESKKVSYLKKAKEVVERVDPKLWVGPHEVSKISKYHAFTRSALILTPSESSKKAINYLLHGIPIVFLDDVIFDSSLVNQTNSLCIGNVKDTKKGLNEIQNKWIDSDMIRTNTIQYMEKKRIEFIEIVQLIFDELGIKRNFDQEFIRFYKHEFPYSYKLYPLSTHIDHFIYK